MDRQRPDAPLAATPRVDYRPLMPHRTDPVPAPTLRPRLGLDDTPPEIHRILIEGYRRMPMAEKARRVVELTHGVQEMALARLRAQHPHATARELQLRLAALWLDADTMRAAVGWAPGDELR